MSLLQSFGHVLYHLSQAHAWGYRYVAPTVLQKEKFISDVKPSGVAVIRKRLPRCTRSDKQLRQLIKKAETATWRSPLMIKDILRIAN